MSRICAAIFIIFAVVSAADGYSRRYRYSSYPYNSRGDDGEGSNIAGYVLAGLAGLTIVILIIVFCIKYHNAKKLRVHQQPLVYTGGRSGPATHTGTVQQPPPYTSSPPVYSLPLPPGHEKSTEGPASYPPIHLRHRPQEAFTSTERTFSPPPAYQPTPQTPHPLPQPLLAPIGSNQTVPGDQSSSVRNSQRQGGNAFIPAPSHVPTAPSSSDA